MPGSRSSFSLALFWYFVLFPFPFLSPKEFSFFPSPVAACWDRPVIAAPAILHFPESFLTLAAGRLPQDPLFSPPILLSGKDHFSEPDEWLAQLLPTPLD